MRSNVRDEEFLQLLRKALEARKKRAALPPKLEPELGREYILRLISKMPSPWREGRHVFVVYDLETGEERRLPTSVVLERELAEAKVGDYILIKLIESRQLSNGRRMRNFEVAVLSSEEVAKLQSLLVQEKTLAQEEAKESPKPEAKAPAKKEAAPSAVQQTQEQLDEVKMLIETLIEVYGSVTLEDLDLYLNVHKKLNVDVKDVVQKLGYVIEGDRVRKP